MTKIPTNPMDYSHAKTTPMMKQWVAIKEKLFQETPEGHEPPIVFCRVGDFYELFYDLAGNLSITYSANAVMVKLGFTPKFTGTIEPSTT